MNPTSRPDTRAPSPAGTSTWVFLREAARNPRAIGAVAPSGRALALQLTEPLHAQAGRPLEIMEVGAGTGSVTATLISRLSDQCRLDVVETNSRFVDRLHLLVRNHPRHAARITVHNTRIEELRTDREYDVIVSGLPFANFEPEQVDIIMSRYLELLRPGGLLTYFAYRGAGAARGLFASRSQLRRHRAVGAVMARYRRYYAIGAATVWANLPPAEVVQLQRPPRCASAPAVYRPETSR